MRISGIAPEYARTKAEEAVASGVLSGIDDSAYDTTNSGQTNNGYKIVDGWGELKANACLVSYMNGYADPRRAAYFTEADESLGGGYIGVRSGTNEPPVPADYNGYSSFRIARVANKGLKDAGANPMPIMYASEAWFLRAEGALRGWDMGGTAGELYEEGIRKSFEEFDVDGAEEYMADSEKRPGNHTDPKSSMDSYTNQSTITIAWNDVDPFHEVRGILLQLLTGKFDGAVVASRSGEHRFKPLQRHIQIRLHIVRQGKGTHAAHIVADELVGLLMGEHLGLGVEILFIGTVVHLGVPGHHDDDGLVIHLEAEALGDAGTLHAHGDGRQVHGGGGDVKFPDAAGDAF